MSYIMYVLGPSSCMSISNNVNLPLPLTVHTLISVSVQYIPPLCFNAILGSFTTHQENQVRLMIQISRNCIQYVISAPSQDQQVSSLWEFSLMPLTLIKYFTCINILVVFFFSGHEQNLTTSTLLFPLETLLLVVEGKSLGPTLLTNVTIKLTSCRKRLNVVHYVWKRQHWYSRITE